MQVESIHKPIHRIIRKVIRVIHMTKEVAVMVDILVALKAHPLLLILYMLVIRRGRILIRLEIITEEGLVMMSTDLEVTPLLVKALVVM